MVGIHSVVHSQPRRTLPSNIALSYFLPWFWFGVAMRPSSRGFLMTNRLATVRYVRCSSSSDRWNLPGFDGQKHLGAERPANSMRKLCGRSLFARQGPQKRAALREMMLAAFCHVSICFPYFPFFLNCSACLESAIISTLCLEVNGIDIS